MISRNTTQSYGWKEKTGILENFAGTDYRSCLKNDIKMGNAITNYAIVYWP